jgi:uncharacterized protein
VKIKLRDIPEGHSPLILESSGESLNLEPWVQAQGMVRLEADVDRMRDQLTIQGTVRGQALGECGRCTGPLEHELTAVLLVIADLRGSDAPQDEAALEQEGSILYHDGLILDLTDPVREALILEEPLVVRCRPDCRGLCPVCGKDLNTGSCDCQRDMTDPRWSSLAKLRKETD